MNDKMNEKSDIIWVGDVKYVRAEKVEAAFILLAINNNYSARSNHAWKLLGEALDAVHSDELIRSPNEEL